ncbi:LysM peptidoglycan-binding domain-containing protein [Bacillus sp. FJAT-49705]|uniref:LysM peptidoglycan-binding domain-containing protein n=1 Tax=Cytobacillus citreus TaxID=2833586 RepID=A0ABS5NMR5_9BACI|nr:CAP domain-containing protein [Cytobacillus citreus]MBS4189092.1 LysM peptidoglycan-binding domain-containing protein [Cytobacillus citreus]
MMNRRVPYIISFLLFISIANSVSAKSTYFVIKGDTLWSIALNHDLKLESIIKSNPHVKNPDLIFPGQTIIIPRSYVSREEITLSQKEKKLFLLTNSERQRYGLKPLIIDSTLSYLARQKSIDMLKKEYVSHNSPTFGDSTLMLKAFKIPFKQVKENIGAGYSSAEEIHLSWMDSTVNKANVLDNRATHIGIGYAEGGIHGHYWTIFIIQRIEGGN